MKIVRISLDSINKYQSTIIMIKTYSYSRPVSTENKITEERIMLSVTAEITFAVIFYSSFA